MSPATFLAKIGIDLDALEAFILARKEQNHAHLPPSDEPLSWDTKGKLVTLDAAIMAAHLMTVRLIFGGFRNLFDQAYRIGANRIQGAIEKLAAAEVANITGIAPPIIALAFQMADIFDDNSAAERKEAGIRKESLSAQRDLWKTALAQRRSKRATKRVLTRHRSKKQRKPNKRWLESRRSHTT